MLWISGDTVLYDGIRQVARRLTVDTAVLDLGAVQFRITGPVRYTMTAREAVALCPLLRPRTVLPVHYEGWDHFREGRQAIEAAFAAAPDEVRAEPYPGDHLPPTSANSESNLVDTGSNRLQPAIAQRGT